MSSLNKVTIIGNVGADPEIRALQNGGEIAHLNIATSESWKDKTTGERKEKTEWHRVVVHNEHILGVVKNYVRKGSKLYLEGQLQTRKWTDKEGQERYTTEVVVPRFKGELVLLSGREQANEQTAHNQAKGNGYQPQPGPDDSIPF